MMMMMKIQNLTVFLTLDDDDKKIQNLTVSEKKILHIRARRAQAGVLMELKN